jgi:hypothetical protein
MTTSVMACMRNEALFVTEWVAYHKVIGFDNIFVCTNNCTDGTDEILDRLQELGLVIHIRNDEMEGLAPQAAGVKKVLAHPVAQASDWLLHIDADEFLNIQIGNGQISELVARAEPFDAMGISWRLFGDCGMTDWQGGLLLEQQVMAEAFQTPFGAMQKTMFRPQRFRAGIDHMPKEPVSPEVTLCNARGMQVPASALSEAGQSNLRYSRGQEIIRKRLFGWEGAYINHYAVRTNDLFMLKNVRGDGIGSRFSKRYFLNSRWYRAANRNEVEDRSIQRHLPYMQALLKVLARDKALAALQRKALKQFKSLKATHLTPENIEAWTNGSDELALQA